MMVQLVRVAAELQALLEQGGHPFCFIGGLAVQRWGRSRLTRDVDGVVFTGLGYERPVIAALLAQYGARHDNAERFAIDARVLLLRDTTHGIGIDLSMGSLDFERRAVERATYEPFTTEVKLRVCSPSDLVVYKAYAGRPLDWDDVEGVLLRHPDRLDFDLIEHELRYIAELAEDDTPIRKLAEVRRRLNL